MKRLPAIMKKVLYLGILSAAVMLPTPVALNATTSINGIVQQLEAKIAAFTPIKKPLISILLNSITLKKINNMGGRLLALLIPF